MQLRSGFPSTIWDGTTYGRSSRTDDIKPGAKDWDRIAAEVLAIENFLFIRLVKVATNSGLDADYNDIAGTLTNNVEQAALIIDEVSLTLNSKVLLKNQPTTTENGLYIVTVVGDEETNWVLTRYDTLFVGLKVVVAEGDVNAGKIFTCTRTGIVVFS